MTRPGQALASPVGVGTVGRESGRATTATRGRPTGGQANDAATCRTQPPARVRLPHSLCLIELPGLRLRNRANGARGSSINAVHAVKRERDSQRGIAANAARSHIGRSAARWLSTGIVVVVTRIAPSVGLDEHDGLMGSAKSVFAGVADALGLANDRDTRVSWLARNERGPWGVIVEIVERRMCSHCGQVVT